MEDKTRGWAGKCGKRSQEINIDIEKLLPQESSNITDEPRQASELLSTTEFDCNSL